MGRLQKLVLLVAILSSFVAFLDIAVVNVALPAIRNELGGGLSAQQWIVDAYLLTLGSLILIAGSLSDLFGRKRILALGLFGFGVTSIAIALAPTVQFLIIMRSLQGIAAALLVPSSLALIVSYFSGANQAKAIGAWTAWTSVAFVVGPLLGGFLVDAVSWRLVFAINVLPIGVTLWLMRGITKKDITREGAKVDWAGSVLAALGLGGPVFALIEQPRYGFSHPKIFLPLIIGLVLLGIFIWHERKTKHPMLPLELFKIRNFRVGNVATLAIYGALTAATFVLILFLQQVADYSALNSGLAILPITLLLILLSTRFGHLAGKYGPRLFMSLGPLLIGLSFLILFFSVSVQANYLTEVFPGIALFGLGLAITVAPLTAAILGQINKEHAGIGSAVNNAIARVAGLIAVAAVGALIAWQYSLGIDVEIAKGGANLKATEILETAKTAPFDLSPSKNLGDEQAFVSQTLEIASLKAFRAAALAMAILMFAGASISAVGIENPKRKRREL